LWEDSTQSSTIEGYTLFINRLKIFVVYSVGIVIMRSPWDKHKENFVLRN
jgi:hypothetical protein